MNNQIKTFTLAALTAATMAGCSPVNPELNNITCPVGQADLYNKTSEYLNKSCEIIKSFNPSNSIILPFEEIENKAIVVCLVGPDGYFYCGNIQDFGLVTGDVQDSKTGAILKGFKTADKTKILAYMVLDKNLKGMNPNTYKSLEQKLIDAASEQATKFGIKPKYKPSNLPAAEILQREI